MEQTELYTEDWIGLRALNERGRVDRREVACTHGALVEAKCKSVVYDAVVKAAVAAP
jgi:hypothetical protein